MLQTEQCDNCGVTIGKLEVPYVYRDHVVCGRCYATLRQVAPKAIPPATYHKELRVDAPQIETHCPHCGSGDTASLGAIYDRGTSRWSGGTIGIAGDDLFFAGSGGSSISNSAARAAPPRTIDNTAHFFAIIVAVVFLIVGIELTSSGISNLNPSSIVIKPDPDARQEILVGALLIVGDLAWVCIAVYCINKNSRWNTQEYPVRLALWRKQWICQRCGTIFEV